ncbi:MAG: hypothetical protein IPK77_02955 [Cellvibrio sp.]|nr:hypothetical protein [Cellvibrio sp.]
MSADSDDEMSYFWVRTEKSICAVTPKKASRYCDEALIKMFCNDEDGRNLGRN